MIVLKIYLTGALPTYLWMCGKDDSADGWVTGFVTALWFLALPMKSWYTLRRVLGR